jgi:hypothetical protein
LEYKIRAYFASPITKFASRFRQSGDKLTVNFKQIIVDDIIVYEDEKNKSKGYNVVNGKKKLNAGNLAILKGGRGNTAKKASELIWSKRGTHKSIQLLLNEFGLYLVKGGLVRSQ